MMVMFASQCENKSLSKTRRVLDDGTFELKIPYNNPTELIMEICRYRDGVEVIEPAELREQVAEALQAAADRYR